jgi:hypothetical protein
MCSKVQWSRGAEVQIWRMEMLNCRDAEMLSCRGADMENGDAEVLRCRQYDGEWRC